MDAGASAVALPQAPFPDIIQADTPRDLDLHFAPFSLSFRLNCPCTVHTISKHVFLSAAVNRPYDRKPLKIHHQNVPFTPQSIQLFYTQYRILHPLF